VAPTGPPAKPMDDHTTTQRNATQDDSEICDPQAGRMTSSAPGVALLDALPIDLLAHVLALADLAIEITATRATPRGAQGDCLPPFTCTWRLPAPFAVNRHVREAAASSPMYLRMSAVRLYTHQLEAGAVEGTGFLRRVARSTRVAEGRWRCLCDAVAASVPHCRIRGLSLAQGCTLDAAVLSLYHSRLFRHVPFIHLDATRTAGSGTLSADHAGLDLVKFTLFPPSGVRCLVADSLCGWTSDSLGLALEMLSIDERDKIDLEGESVAEGLSRADQTPLLGRQPAGAIPCALKAQPPGLRALALPNLNAPDLPISALLQAIDVAHGSSLVLLFLGGAVLAGPAPDHVYAPSHTDSSGAIAFLPRLRCAEVTFWTEQMASAETLSAALGPERASACALDLCRASHLSRLARLVRDAEEEAWKLPSVSHHRADGARHCAADSRLASPCADWPSHVRACARAALGARDQARWTPLHELVVCSTESLLAGLEPTADHAGFALVPGPLSQGESGFRAVCAGPGAAKDAPGSSGAGEVPDGEQQELAPDLEAQGHALSPRPLSASHGRLDCSGEPPAAAARRAAAVALALRLGASAQVKDIRGATPTFRAAYLGRTDSLRALLRHGGPESVLVRNHALENPLYIAALRGHASSVRAIVHEWAAGDEARMTALLAPARFHDGWSPLHAAAIARSAPIVRVLLDVGFDARCLNRHGQTPLHVAARCDAADCLALLVETAGTGALQERDEHGTTVAAVARKHCSAYARAMVSQGLDAHPSPPLEGHWPKGGGKGDGECSAEAAAVRMRPRRTRRAAGSARAGGGKADPGSGGALPLDHALRPTPLGHRGWEHGFPGVQAARHQADAGPARPRAEDNHTRHLAPAPRSEAAAAASLVAVPAARTASGTGLNGTPAPLVLGRGPRTRRGGRRGRHGGGAAGGGGSSAVTATMARQQPAEPIMRPTQPRPSSSGGNDGPAAATSAGGPHVPGSMRPY